MIPFQSGERLRGKFQLLIARCSFLISRIGFEDPFCTSSIGIQRIERHKLLAMAVSYAYQSPKATLSPPAIVCSP